MTTKVRQTFAVRLAGLISPDTSGATLDAIAGALPSLADLPDAMFTAISAANIAPQCSTLPDANELRRLLLSRKTTSPPSSVKPRPPEWLIGRILESCQGQPDGALAAWLADRQVWPDDIAAWRGSSVPAADWADAGKVLRSVRAILDPPHPQATFLLGMLNSLVGRHAPQNVELVPLTPPGAAPEPSPESPPAVEAKPAVIPNYLPDDVAALVYAKSGIRNPRQPTQDPT